LNIPSFERLDFRAMAKVTVWEMKKHLPAVVVGSSLGALVALQAERRVPIAPLVLIAPALGFGSRWVERLPPGDAIPVFHHSEERELPIHRRFFEEMARADPDREAPAAPVTVIMGRKDESVPFDIVRETWSRWEASGRLHSGSRFIEVPDGDHGLIAHVGLIADAISRAGGGASVQTLPEPG
jgi:pimeloyl-ACP methyl ester carboxylesterase